MPAKKVKQRNTFEAYDDPRDWVLPNWEQNHRDPSAFNGMCNHLKYRVIVELVNEPDDVIRARLLKLWRESERNHHNWNVMQAAAAKYGLELDVKEQGEDFRK